MSSPEELSIDKLTEEIGASAKTDLNRLYFAAGWLLLYGDRKAVNPDHKLFYECECLRIASKFDWNPETAQDVIWAFEEETIQDMLAGARYGQA